MTTAQFFAERRAQLEAAVLDALHECAALTGTTLRREVGAGPKEMARVLESMRDRGLVTSHKRRWSLP